MLWRFRFPWQCFPSYHYLYCIIAAVLGNDKFCQGSSVISCDPFSRFSMLHNTLSRGVLIVKPLVVLSSTEHAFLLADLLGHLPASAHLFESRPSSSSLCFNPLKNVLVLWFAVWKLICSLTWVAFPALLPFSGMGGGCCKAIGELMCFYMMFPLSTHCQVFFFLSWTKLRVRDLGEPRFPLLLWQQPFARTKEKSTQPERFFIWIVNSIWIFSAAEINSVWK